MAKNNTSQHDEHRPDVGMYVKVFGALMVLTLITVAISKVHLPRPQAIGLGLFVASIKAALVGALFMHLWGENKLIHKMLWITVGCGAIMVISMIDFALVTSRSTSPIAVADQHPGGHGESHEQAHIETVTEIVTLPAPAKTAKKAH